MPPLTPPPQASPEIALRDIAPLPIFPYVPSVAVWLAVGVVLLAVWWLVLRAPNRRGGLTPDAVGAVEAAIDRCLRSGVPRDEVFTVSRAVKVLFRSRALGDFTALTPGELRRRAAGGVEGGLARALQILAELDESKYRPDPATLESPLHELRALLAPLGAPPGAVGPHGGTR